MNNEPFSFEINEIGILTKEQWVGKFKAKVRLSFRDQLRKDQIKCELLGNSSKDLISSDALNQAIVFSDLAVRLVETPSWWKEKGNGLDLEDANVVNKVYEKALEVEKKQNEEAVKEAEKAKDEMKKSLKE